VDVEAAVRFKGYLDLFFRRKWWIVIPTVLSFSVSPFVYEALPKMYRASTTILVTPQTFSTRVGETMVTATVAERVANLAVQILSNTYLQTVVEEMDLVSPGADDATRQSAANRLKKRIELEHDPLQLSWFRVAALDENPEQAAQIANRLAELFIEQNSIWRKEQASAATETVDVWLQEKRAELAVEEQRMAAYRKKYLYELPEHMNANLQLANAAEQRRASLSREIQGRIDQLTILQAQLQSESSLDPTLVGKSTDPAIRELTALQDELRELRVRYTEENPIVRNKVAAIEELKKTRPDLFGPQGSTASDVTGTRGNIARIEQEIATLEAERKRVEGEIASYTERISRTPLREAELAELTRDYNIQKREYEDLLKTKGLAARGEDLEDARKGDQFRIQDPALPPLKPYQPVLIQVILLCTIVGLGAGVGVAALLEFLDQTFKNEDEFRSAFPDIPVLVSIPTIDGGGRTRKKVKRTGARRTSDAATWLVLGLLFPAVVAAVSSWWM